MQFTTLNKLEVSGRRVLLRADLNVPLKDGIITNAARINRFIPTLENLLSRGAAIVLCTHLGRPSGVGYESQFTLKPIADWLLSYGFNLTFADDIIGNSATSLAKKVEPGQILLLENLRFDSGEVNNDLAFINKLASLADVYVNDAFGVSHRAHASVYGIIAKFPNKNAIGLLMEKELSVMEKILYGHRHPIVLLMGGSKVADKVDVIRNFLGKADVIAIGGAMSFTFLKSFGIDIGNSRYEKDKLILANELYHKASEYGTKILLPSDHVVAMSMDDEVNCNITQDQIIPSGNIGLDIGPETAAIYMNEINKAGTVIWNGPMGAFETDIFATGTISIAEELASAQKRGAFCLIGGGDTISAVTKSGVIDCVSYVSTGGGASLEFLSGMELPGVVAMRNAPNEIEEKKIIVANWKMNHLSESVKIFCQKFKAHYVRQSNVDVAIAPSLIFIDQLSSQCGKLISIYGQNAHERNFGAYTGEVSMLQIKDIGASGVIIGHSERRLHCDEDNDLLVGKLKAAWENDLLAILCVGEDLIQFNRGDTISVLKRQLSILNNLEPPLKRLIIAYEPVWAIGTNCCMTSKKIALVHNAIRCALIATLGLYGHEVPIIYGGGVNKDNIGDIIMTPGVNGCLVGGFSLDVDNFLELISHTQKIMGNI